MSENQKLLISFSIPIGIIVFLYLLSAKSPVREEESLSLTTATDTALESVESYKSLREIAYEMIDIDYLTDSNRRIIDRESKRVARLRVQQIAGNDPFITDRDIERISREVLAQEIDFATKQVRANFIIIGALTRKGLSKKDTLSIVNSMSSAQIREWAASPFTFKEFFSFYVEYAEQKYRAHMMTKDFYK